MRELLSKGRTLLAEAPIVLLLVLSAAIILYRPPSEAAQFHVTDSIEYSVAARRLMETGSYGLQVVGQIMPPRYLPWFSLFTLIPGYKLFGPNLGNAAYPVLFYALVAIVAAYFLGKRIGGSCGGIAAAIGLLILADFRYMAHEAMTDVPCATLLLLLALLWGARRNKENGKLYYFFAGILAALAAAFRALYVVATVPFLIQACREKGAKRKAISTLLLIEMLFFVGLLSNAYNSRVFGSPWRSGYNFWAPVPYDYPWLVFSLSYIPQNLALVFSHTPLFALLLIVASVPVLKKRATNKEIAAAIGGPEFDALCRFWMCTALPMALVHVVYFYSSSRFYLPSEAILVVIAGGLCGQLLECYKLSLRKQVLGVAVLFSAILSWRMLAPTAPPPESIFVELNRGLPEVATLITGVNPVLAAAQLNDPRNHRRILPISRRIEYASKLVAYSRIESPDPPPQSATDHRCDGLKKGGAVEAVPDVAVEILDDLVAAEKNGVQLFVDTSLLEADELDVLSKRFAMQPLSTHLQQLKAKAGS